MTENYLSGKKRSLKLGVSGHSENSTSLQTVGGVGIGTTNTDKRALYVVGNTEITGVLTASSYSGDGSGLTGVAATDHVATFDLVVAGISTFHDDVRITGGGINAVGVITGTSFDGAITEWIITSNGSSDYRFTGSGFDGTENDPTIYLVRGQEYNFTNNMGAHPFEIRTAINGSAYNDGITNNGVSNGTLTWDVQMDAPNILYYQCTAHAGMVGKIYIGNSGDSINVGTGGLVISGVTTGINAAGVSSFIQLDVNTGGIDVDGPTELDELNVTGVSTFTSSLKVDGAVDIGTGGLDVDGQTDLDELVVAGVSTFTGNIVAATAEFSGNVTIGGTLTVEDKTNVDSIGLITARTGVRVTAGGIDVTAGVSTFNDTVKFDGAVDIGTGGVDIDGQLDVDELIVAGVSTFSKAIDLNAGIDVDGQADLDELVVAGVTTFSNDVFVGTAITIHAGNIHATGIISAIKFVGDGSQITNLPGINTLGTSNLSDVNVSGTTTTSQLRVSGIGTAEKLFVSTGGFEVDGQTDLDELVVAGVATFSAYPSIDADNEIQVGTAIQLGKAGVITATSFEGSGANLTGIAATDHVSTFDLVVAGISTFNDDVRILSGGLNVVGVSTFNDNVHLLDNDKLLLGGSAGTHDGLEIYHSGSHNYITDSGSGNLYIGGNQILITDSGASNTSAIFNPASYTSLYHTGSEKIRTTAVGATVFGNFKSTTLHVAGISTLTGDINFVGSLDNVNVTGAALTTINVKAIGGNYTGVVTASSFSGSLAEGDSKVEVTDSGTGQINVVVDGSHITRFLNGKVIVGSNVAVQNNYGSNNGDIIIANGDRTLRLFRTGVGLADDSVIGAIDFAAQQSGTGGQTVAKIESSLRGGVENKADLIFSTSNGGSDEAIEKLRIMHTGNVGIGITNPTSKLHVTGDTKVSGVVTATSFSGSGANLTSLNAANLGSGTIPDARFPATLPAISGVNLTNLPTGINTANDSTFKDLSVTGLKVAGISTFNSAVDINAVVDIDGQLDVDELIVAGVSTFTGAVSINAASGFPLILQASNSSIPAIKINNQSGTQRGQILANDHLNIEAYGNDIIFDPNHGGGTAGDILLKSNSTTIVEVPGDGAGVIVTGIVTATTFSGALSGNATSATTATTATTATNVTVADESSDTSCNVLFTTAATGDLAPKSGTNLTFNSDTGALSATAFSGDGSNLTGIGTQGPDGAFFGITVAGVSTFHDDVRITGGGINAVGVITATSFSGDGSNLSGVGTQGINVQARSLVVSGVSTFYNDVKIVGGGSTAGNQITIGATTLNDGTLTFDGSAGQLFSITNNLTDGSIFSVNDVSGMPSIDVGAAGTIQLAPHGAGELVGIGTTRPTSKLDVVGDVQVVGVVTATSFSGSGANLTNIPASTDGSFIGLNVSGVSTLSGATTISNDLTIESTNPKLIFTDTNGAPDYNINCEGGKLYFNDSSDNNRILIEVDGHIEIPGNLEVASNITAIGGNYTGVVTATSFSGSGANLTGVGTQGINIQAQSLTVAGVTTFHGQINVGTGITIQPSTGIISATKFSGTFLSDGQYNTVVGTNAGRDLTSNSNSNNYFGHVAGEKNDTGDNNCGFGRYSAYSIESGSKNTMLGNESGVACQSGSGNVCLGFQAGYDVTGSNNTLIGHMAAGKSTSSSTDLTSGSNNIFIGHDVKSSTTTISNEIAIGSTFTDHFRLPGIGVSFKVGGNAYFTGIVTATKLDIGTGGIDVDGQTDLDELVVAGVSTFSGSAYFTAQDNYFKHDNATVRFQHSSATQQGAIIVGNSNFDIFTHSGGSGGFRVYTGGSYKLTLDSSGTLSATTFSGSGANLTNIATGILTASTSTFKDIVVTGGVNVSGVVTASSFSGDGSALTNLPASESTGDFYVGFTSSVTMNTASYETTGHTFPSTASKTYVIDSIMASNVANVGIGTTVNLIASISSNSGVAAGTTEQTYFAYNIPIAAGGAVELIKEPFVANPNDIVKLWATDSTYSGISSAIQVHMTYTQQDSTDFFGKYAANTSIGSTTIIGIHTAGTTKSATIQSVHITNRSDAGAFPVDIMLTDSTGIVTTYLVKNLVIPQYSAVEILERPKRMETGSSLGVKVQQTGTIDVIVSGKTYS